MFEPIRVRRAYVEGLFGQMHIRRAGVGSDRPALLCFHMSPMSGRIYEAFLPLIGGDRLAIAPDTPGYGSSDRPSDPPEIGDYSKAMERLIEVMRLPLPVDLFGYHTGTKIAIDLAIQRPDLVRRVIAVSAPIYTVAERESQNRTYHPDPPQADGSHLLGLWRGMVTWNLHSGATLETIEDEFPDMLLGRNHAGWGHRAAFRYDLAEHLRKVHQPVLILRPKDDLYAQTGRAAGHLQNGYVLTLPGWAHGFLIRHAQETADLVRQFLDGPEGSPFADLVIPPDAEIARPLPGHPS